MYVAFILALSYALMCLDNYTVFSKIYSCCSLTLARNLCRKDYLEPNSSAIFFLVPLCLSQFVMRRFVRCVNVIAGESGGPVRGGAWRWGEIRKFKTEVLLQSWE